MDKKKLAIIISSTLGGAAIIASVVSLCVVVANTPKYRLVYDNKDVTDLLFTDQTSENYRYISTVQDVEVTTSGSAVQLFDLSSIVSKNSNFKDFMIVCNISFTVQNTTSEPYDATKYSYTSGEATISTGEKDFTYTFSKSSSTQIKNYKLTSNSTEISVKLSKEVTYKTIKTGESEETKNAVVSVKASNMYLFGFAK